jgi:hypothetical protein
MKRNGQPQDGTNTSDSNKCSAADSLPSNHIAARHIAFIEQLNQRLEETRLPAELREQILANLPPPEERERLFRELMEKGGLSSEEFFASLGLEVERQP